MAVQSLETDYFVVGGGAMGIAFIDEVLKRDKKSKILLVDKHDQIGGHWNDAYPFVNLHQPAAYYGVNSEPLGPGGAALVSGTEVLDYYQRVMKKLLATGRLEYYPSSEWCGENRFRSLDGGAEYEVTVNKKTVDATYMKVEVPSTRPPQFQVDDGVNLVPVNDIFDVREPWSRYVVVGAGRTGIDAVLHLLDNGVEPRDIDWIMPNDSWLDNRKNISPGHITKGLYNVKDWVEATTLKELFEIRESLGEVFRLDRSIWPTKYKCATVDEREFEQIKRIDNIVRLGRVLRIRPDAIELEQGSIPTDSKTLHVDCSADGLARREIQPVFAGNRITLQSLATCQQVFSAALIGHVEARYSDDLTKNDLCAVVAHPEHTIDWVRVNLVSNDNTLKWASHFPIWFLRCRLNFQAHESLLSTIVASIRLAKPLSRFTKLLPKIYAQEFPDEPRPGVVRMMPIEITNGVWEIPFHVSPGPAMKIGTRMTILRLDDGSLLLHSPIQLDRSQIRAINELGPVRHLVSPNLFHQSYMRQAAAIWPEAKVWGSPDLQSKNRQLEVDTMLTSGALWPGIDVFEIEGSPDLQEFVLFHRASSTLLTTDLVFNEPTGQSLGGRLFLKASGVSGRFAISRVIKSTIKDKAAFGKSLQPLLELPVERIVMAHGEVLETEAKAKLTEVLSPFVAQ